MNFVTVKGEKKLHKVILELRALVVVDRQIEFQSQLREVGEKIILAIFFLLNGIITVQFITYMYCSIELNETLKQDKYNLF